MLITVEPVAEGWWSYDVTRSGGGQPKMRATGERPSLAAAVEQAIEDMRALAQEDS
jgi:hypothetical protein